MRHLLLVLCIPLFSGANGKFLARENVGMLGSFPELGEVQHRVPRNQWFPQKLDHFDPTNPGIWSQRYKRNPQWFNYSSTSPVFLMILGEGKMSDSWDGAWTWYAQKFSALCFKLEHRFYGKSQPTGNLSISSLRYLSSEQALADIAHFIKGMTKKYHLTATNKWIVFGGSYAGSLAAWARLKYPHLIHAAVSSSAPVLAKLNFRAYNDAVRQSLAAWSPLCAKSVHLAALKVQDGLKQVGASEKFAKLFNLCTPLDLSDEKSVAYFIKLLADNIYVQGDYKNVNNICKIMTNSTIGTLLDRYALLHRADHRHCTNISYSGSIEEMKRLTASNRDRSWMYQKCTEFGFFKTSSSRKDLFGSGMDLHFFIEKCKDIFGAAFDPNRLSHAIRRVNSIYGQLDIVNRVTNVIFVQGSLDPWHALGVCKSSNSLSPAILIKGATHCADLSPPRTTDPLQLTAARRRIEEFLEDCLTTDTTSESSADSGDRKGILG